MWDHSYILLLLTFIPNVILAQDDNPYLDFNRDYNDPFDVGLDQSLFIGCELKQAPSGSTPNLRWENPAGDVVGSTPASGGGSSVWVQSQGQISLELNFRGITSDMAGPYKCKADVNGETLVKSINIDIFVPLGFVDCKETQTAVINKVGKITCEAEGTGTLTYTWRYKDNGTRLFPADHPKNYNGYVKQESGGLQIRNVGPEHNIDLSVQIRSSRSSNQKYQSIRIQVLVPPTIDRPPSASSPVVGEEAEMFCEASGDPAPQYYWSKAARQGDVPVVLQSTPDNRIRADPEEGRLVIKDVTKGDEGYYYCNATNPAENVQSKPVRLRVLSPPVIEDLRNGTGKQGGGGKLECIANGDPAPDLTWTKVGEQADITDGEKHKVSEQKDNTRTTLKLEFTRLEPSDAGDYVCKAVNDAGEASKTANMDVTYPPNFDNQPTGPFYNWVGNQNGRITCIANGNEAPIIRWMKNGKEADTGQFEKTMEKTKYQTVSHLRVIMAPATEASLIGDYVCIAENSFGRKNTTVQMLKAGKPNNPGVTAKKVTATVIKLILDIPTVAGPKVQNFTVKYKIAGSEDNLLTKTQIVEWRFWKDNQPNPRTEVDLDNLKPVSAYSVEVTAKNDVGEGLPTFATYNTKALSKPESPILDLSRMPNDGPKSTSYDLLWSPGYDGGSAVLTYKLRYRDIIVFANKSDTGHYVMKSTTDRKWGTWLDLGLQNQYTIRKLVPNTFYQIEIKALNSLGDSPPSWFIFKTKDVEPIEDDNDDNGGAEAIGEVGEQESALSTGAIIGIIIGVFILLFIIVDVTCYYKNKCGVLNCIKEKVSGGGGGKETDVEKAGEEEREPLKTGAAEPDTTDNGGMENVNEKEPLADGDEKDATDEGKTTDVEKGEEVKELEPEQKEEKTAEPAVIEEKAEEKPVEVSPDPSPDKSPVKTPDQSPAKEKTADDTPAE